MQTAGKTQVKLVTSCAIWQRGEARKVRNAKPANQNKIGQSLQHRISVNEGVIIKLHADGKKSQSLWENRLKRFKDEKNKSTFP